MIWTVYDYETLSVDPATAPILSVAFIQFDTDKFTTEPYDFLELVSSSKEYKFDVKHQVKDFGKKIDKDTLEWWNNLPKELKDRQLKPLDTDLHISELHGIIKHECENSKLIFTRGNTFDPVITEQLMKDTGNFSPYKWWSVRDTRSFLEGAMWGSNMSNDFMPEGLGSKFIKHDPCHDIAMDVMRMQTVIQVIS